MGNGKVYLTDEQRDVPPFGVPRVLVGEAGYPQVDVEDHVLLGHRSAAPSDGEGGVSGGKKKKDYILFLWETRVTRNMEETICVWHVFTSFTF